LVYLTSEKRFEEEKKFTNGKNEYLLEPFTKRKDPLTGPTSPCGENFVGKDSPKG
jgi:hypothetical protein